MLVQVAQAAIRTAEEEKSSTHSNRTLFGSASLNNLQADSYTGGKKKSSVSQKTLFGIALAGLGLVAAIPLASKLMGKKIVLDVVSKLGKDSGVTAKNFKVSVSGFNKVHIETQNLPDSNFQSITWDWMKRKLTPHYQVVNAAKGKQVEDVVNSSEAVKMASTRAEAIALNVSAHVVTSP